MTDLERREREHNEVLRYADGRRGQIVADAHVDGDVVKQIAQRGKQQGRRDRRPRRKRRVDPVSTDRGRRAND